MTMSDRENKRKCFKCGSSPAEDHIKLFRFPNPGERNLLRCALWAKYVFPERQYSDIVLQRNLHSEHRMLCQRHFRDEDFTDTSMTMLLRSAIPCDRDAMAPQNESGTPPDTPSRNRRRPKKAGRERSSSSSSSDDEASPSKMLRMLKSSTKDVLRLFRDSSINSWNDSHLSNVIPEFDPLNRAQSIERWLKRVNECAVMYGWNERQVVHFALQKLTGLAKKWFESLPTIVFTWEEWQIKLKKAFPSEENYGRLLEEMLSRTSNNEESLQEYFYDKLGLLNRCEISGKKAVDCIIYGISDRSIRNGAQALNSSEPDDLLNFLCSQEPQPSMSTKIRERLSHNQKPSSSASGKNINTFNTSATNCYNCREPGHPYFKCPKPLIKCKRCNRIGHDRDDCRLEPFVPFRFKGNHVGNPVIKKDK